jgi:TRAP-type C4-dicarboxylate transport system substrate-binding protein
MKAKKVLSSVLALAMILVLASCSSNAGSPIGACRYASGRNRAFRRYAVRPCGRYRQPEKTYVFSLPLEQSNRQQPQRDGRRSAQVQARGKIGRAITIEIYPSNTLVGAKEMLDALKNGTVDMGYFVANSSPPVPLHGALRTPGLKYGGIAEVDKIIREFTKQYPDAGFDAFKIITRYSIGTMGLISVKPVTSVNDIKGMSIRTTSNFMPFFTGMGCNCVSMGAGDVYEAIKTNVINGTVTGLNGLATYNLGEVCNAVTPLYMLNGDEFVVMSDSAYGVLSPELQGVVDEVASEMDAVLTEYTQFEQDGAIDAAKKSNDKFEVVELSAEAEAKFMEAAAPLLDAKAAELDKAGLDGSGALAWLRAQAK